MSNTENQTEATESEFESTLPAVDELTKLKQRADLMGMKYHPNIGVEALRARINAKLNDEPDPDEKVALAKTEAAPEVETEAQLRKRMKEECTALVRINVTCMNPAKKEWDGEIFTVGNSFLPTQKKMVPFNTTEGFHVPKIMFDVIKGRECQIFYTEKAKNGVKVRKGRLIKEFSVEVLDPLTPTELKELAQRQAMAAGQSS
jgi:hypothetical protein